MAILSCVPLIGCAADPPLWCVLPLWTLAGLIGLTATTMLAVSWTQLHGHLPQAARPGAAEYEDRRLLIMVSAMEAPSTSSGMITQAPR